MIGDWLYQQPVHRTNHGRNYDHDSILLGPGGDRLLRKSFYLDVCCLEQFRHGNFDVSNLMAFSWAGCVVVTMEWFTITIYSATAAESSWGGECGWRGDILTVTKHKEWPHLSRKSQMGILQSVCCGTRSGNFGCGLSAAPAQLEPECGDGPNVREGRKGLLAWLAYLWWQYEEHRDLNRAASISTKCYRCRIIMSTSSAKTETLI